MNRFLHNRFSKILSNVVRNEILYVSTEQSSIGEDIVAFRLILSAYVGNAGQVNICTAAKFEYSDMYRERCLGSKDQSPVSDSNSETT